MKVHLILVSVLFVVTLINAGFAEELEIGVETIEPGITFIFEAAETDTIYPKGVDLAADEADTHIEARANWAEDEITSVPEGTPRGGFVAYLNITATITNESSGETLNVDLMPIVNLIDNQHYSKNIKLPGEVSDSYTVTFVVNPPEETTLAFHSDWKDQYEVLFEGQEFTYSAVNF